MSRSMIPFIRMNCYSGIMISQSRLSRPAGVYSRESGGEGQLQRESRIGLDPANVLDAKTLVIHSASTTHSQLTTDELKKAGVEKDAVRISVGLEELNDITADLDQALKAAHE